MESPEIRKLSPYVRLTCVNMLVFGIELTISAGFSYLPPMLLKAGFGEVAMTWIMGVGPFFALLTVPFLGSWSDNCTSSWGRRKPFMLGISLTLMASIIFIVFGHLTPTFLNVFLLVTGSVLLNYCCQVGLNPCEALIADMTENSVHHQLGFTIYSIMISLGGCVGYLITAIDWSNTSLYWFFQSSERTSFAFVFVLLIISLLLTLLMADDKPLIVISHSKSLPSKRTSTNRNYEDIGYESASNDSQEDTLIPHSTSLPMIHTSPDKCPIKCFQVAKRLLPKKLRRIYCQMFISTRSIVKKIRCLWTGPVRFVKNCAEGCHNLIQVPRVLRLLFFSDLFCWTALMCQLMYYTDYVGQRVYGGDPKAPELSEARKLYDEGVRMGSFGLLLHGIVSSIYACTLQKYLLKRYGCRFVYFLGLFIYTISMSWTLLTDDLFMINLMAAISGTGFAAITTIPYMLISAYHSQPDIYFPETICSKSSSTTTSIDDDSMEDDAIPDDISEELRIEDNDEGKKHNRGFGVDLAVLDAAYFLSQTVISLFIGSIVDATQSVTAYIAIAAFFGAVSCFYSTTVVFPPHI
ncbi:hypothetical protein CHUAL_002192 [Chamberlinius hualienensis]